MNILLTGASGFLGSALAARLLQQGHELALLLRQSSNTHRLGGIEHACRIGRPRSDAEIVDFIAEVRPQAVIHTACSYGRQQESPLTLLDTNVRFGMVLLQALQNQPSAQRICFIHTGSVLAPDVSPYALSKQQFAQWGRVIAQSSGGRLQFINVLLQHMYGPGDDRFKFSSHVIHACLSNLERLELTAGEQQRDFIYIDDVVSAFETLLRHADQLGGYDDVPLGSGVAPSVREFVQTVHALSGSRTRLDFGAFPYRPSEAMHCQADISRLRSLGWNPAYDLRAGLQKTLEQERRS